MNKTCIDDIMKYSFLSQPEFSQDGSRAAFIRKQGSLETDSYISELWMWRKSDDTVKKLADLKAAAIYCWLNGSEVLYPVSPFEGEPRGLKITHFEKLNTDTLERKAAFTVPLDVKEIAPLDGGRFLVKAWVDTRRPRAELMEGEEQKKALEEIALEERFQIIDEIPFWWNGTGFTDKVRNTLFIYDPADGALEQLTEDLFETTHFSVSQDCSHIYCSGQVLTDKKMMTDGVYDYCVETGEMSCIIGPEEMRVHQIAAFKGGVVIAASDMKRYGMYENPHLWYADDAGLVLLNEYDHSICDGVNSDVKLGGGNVFKADGDYVYMLSTEGFDTGIFRLDIKGNVRYRVLESGAINCFDVKNGELVYAAQRELRQQEIYKCCPVTGTEQRITEFNREFEEKTVSKPVPLNFVDDRGILINGWVMPAVGAKPGEKYPAILDIHGGPPSAYGEIFFHEMQYWAACGYYVFFCNPVGGDGRGNEFMDIRGRWGNEDYEDLMRFTDEVLKYYPQIDRNRVGVTGGSYGGFMTNWIIGHTDRFAAAVSQRSVANWSSKIGTGCAAYMYNMDQLAVDFWKGHDEIWNHSPLKYAANVKTPTLFIHSEKDYDCFIGEGLQMFTALKMNGCTAKMCIFKGENHELSRSGRPAARIRRLKEITDWFDRYLK